MGNGQKRQWTNHVIIVTSDAKDAEVRQIKIKTWILGLIVILVFALFGALIGFLFYEERIWQAAIEKSNGQLRQMEAMAEENEKVKAQMESNELELRGQIQALSDEVQVVSKTLNQKVESEKALMEELEKLSIPSNLPLNGSAYSIESEGTDKPVAKIVSYAGNLVVATAKGTVIAVNEDVVYGHNVWIDHGNGYVTIYRNASDPMVKQGDMVYQGTTIFVLDAASTQVGYQMMKDGEYVNPLDVIDIKG
ncbi:MAG: peptidoglycan DD-metalloendopeptidase family protein [Lachnospiraceae bacterium]|nr:peptidoglycan DD-metalloendopeptidase family protein [Lachnospiraceae bacterium]